MNTMNATLDAPSGYHSEMHLVTIRCTIRVYRLGEQRESTAAVSCTFASRFKSSERSSTERMCRRSRWSDRVNWQLIVRVGRVHSVACGSCGVINLFAL
jgi:hypothetical protein